MKISKLAILPAILILASCGRDKSGTYQGTETTQTQGGAYQYGYGYQYGYQNYGNATPVPQANQQETTLTLTLSHQDGDNVTGTWVSANGTGNLTGTIDGNQLTNVNLTVTNASMMGYQYQYGYQYGYQNNGTGNTTGNCMTTTYTGQTLSFKDDQISGSLISNSASQNCPSMVKIVNAKKTN